MTLQQLRDFVASVEHGSLRRAAHAEGKSEASLSKSIKRLEISVGTELLRRGALGISLTEAGKVLLARAQLILSEVELAQLEVSPGGKGQRSVSFGASPLAGFLLAPAALRDTRSIAISPPRYTSNPPSAKPNTARAIASSHW